MESFFHFLTEKKQKERTEFNLNDAKGKLYEILAGSHLHHGTHAKSGLPNNFLSHFRDEEGKSPEEVHDFIKGELEKRNPGMYETINDHARHASDYMKDQLAKAGHKDIKDVAWTSQAGDHRRFTGHDDPNSDADVMVHSNKGPVGLSLKYGTSKNMNLRNNGLETLESLVGSDKGGLTQHREQHQQNLKSIGISNHQDYKMKRDSEDPQHQEQVAQAEASAMEAQKGMAKHMADHLGKMNHEGLRDYISKVIAPENKFQHFRMHSRPSSDEVNSGVSHSMEDVQHGKHMLDTFEHLRAKPHSGGISFQIEGKRTGSEKYEPVLDQAIKKGSGPTKGFASTTKAPFLTKVTNVPSAKSIPLSKVVQTKPIKKEKQVVQEPAAAAPKAKTLRKVVGKAAVSQNKSVQKLASSRQSAARNDGTVGGFAW